MLFYIRMDFKEVLDTKMRRSGLVCAEYGNICLVGWYILMVCLCVYIYIYTMHWGAKYIFHYIEHIFQFIAW